MTKRAMSHEKASAVKINGHAKEKEFAILIGLNEEYQNDKKAKKDVIDFNGDAHSIKSGKWWQIFLYSASRLDTDYGFLAMNGMGQLLKDCLDIFPNDRNDYETNKSHFKELLKKPMTELSDKLQSINRRKTFLAKAFFNGGEVQFLSVFENDKVFVFYYEDVVDILADNLSVQNSKAQNKNQMDAQKVLFKNSKGINVGEIEVRNESEKHYKQIKFRVNKDKILNILLEKITEFDMPKQINGIDNKRIIRYGRAIKKFWKKK